MASIAFITRKALVTQSNISVNSGASFGPFLTTAYPRLTGLAYAVGSMALRMQSYIDPTGSPVVSSAWNISSGPNFFDVPNRASYLAVDVTIAISGGVTGSLLITGETLH